MSPYVPRKESPFENSSKSDIQHYKHKAKKNLNNPSSNHLNRNMMSSSLAVDTNYNGGFAETTKSGNSPNNHANMKRDKEQHSNGVHPATSFEI